MNRNTTTQPQCSLKKAGRRLQLTLFVIFMLLCFSGTAAAVSSYFNSFTSMYPASTTATTASWSTTSARCNVCHSSGGGSDLNPYGAAWAIRHNAGRTPTQAFQDIEGDNSDGSATSNIDEITNNAQPGWRPGPNNTFFDLFSPATVTVTGQNPPSSLIGNADPSSPPPPPTLPMVSIGANLPNASETGPTQGQFTVTRTGATTAALTVNYSVGGSATNGTDYGNLPGSVTIAAGSTTAPINVTPVDDALVESNETVVLTLSANAAYTIGSPSSATVTIADNDSVSPPPPPTPKGPMIALSVAKVDFGQTQTNTTATRTASVHNIGDATLDVTAIARCQGTSGEYTWSPDTFTVAPGAAQTLTIFYAPLDQTTDDGCLQIASNDADPAHNPEVLGVAGVGVVSVGGDLMDVDIARLKVDRKFNLARSKPIKIRLTVKISGAGTGTADATIVGVQNNQEIYHETITIAKSSLKAGKSKESHHRKKTVQTLTFPSYTPAAPGDIVWTVTISDADPDFDEATATTKVTQGTNGHHGGGDDDDDDEHDDEHEDHGRR